MIPSLGLGLLGSVLLAWFLLTLSSTASNSYQSTLASLGREQDVVELYAHQLYVRLSSEMDPQDHKTLERIQNYLDEVGMFEGNDLLLPQDANAHPDRHYKFWSPRLDAQRAQALQTYHLTLVALFLCGAFGLFGLTAGIGFHYRHLVFNELRADFISALSHELRTPIAAARLLAETLDRRLGGDPNARDYPKRIVDELESLSFLVENILPFARINKGRLSLSISELQFEDVVDVALEQSARWTNKTLDISKIGLKGLRLHVDPDMMILLFQNLIRNAYNYNDRNPVEIRIEAVLHDRKVSIYFRDNGIGIPKAEWNKIFDEYYRSPSSSNRYRGSGLGLALCAKIATLHGGSLRVAQSDSSGTTFELNLMRASV